MAGFNTIQWCLVTVVYFFGPSCIGLSPVSTVSCLQCSVNRCSIPSNKWVALTRVSWRVVCMVDCPLQTKYFCVSRGSGRHYSSEMGEFTIFLCKNFLRILYTKDYKKSVHFSASYSKNRKSICFLRQCRPIHVYKKRHCTKQTFGIYRHNN